MHWTTVDWVVLAIVGLAALAGMRRGLVASGLSLAGLALGAYAGSRFAPHLLHGGSSSPWTSVAGLAGAVVGAGLFQAVAGILGSFVRGGLRLTPFRLLDSLGGLVLGALTGLALVWAIGAAAQLVPGQTRLRREVLRSEVVRRLNQEIPPRRLLHLLARIDPFPSIAGPAAPGEAPTPKSIRTPAIEAASRSVVRVLGTACGVGVEGSGWFATSHLVVTAAHVVAGEHDTVVEVPDRRGAFQATPVAFDSHNDVAVLRVDAVAGRPLQLADPRPGASVAIVGYPENGPLTKTPGRIGRTAVALTRDAYGKGPVPRTITAVAGTIRHGDSGGPAIDRAGAVQATIFAARVGASGGFGVPQSPVVKALASADRKVSTGACAG